MTLWRALLYQEDTLIEVPLVDRSGAIVGITTVDDIDEDLAAGTWRMMKGVHGHRYAWRGENRRTVFLHRLILERIIGRKPERHDQTDHVDGDGLNNLRGNLRLATHAQNMANRKSRHRYLGVSPERNKWRAQITVDRKTRYLGHFPTQEAAALAYNSAAIEAHGEFANLNNVSAGVQP